MREDMAKIIVERPRLGGHGMRRGRVPRDLENLPGFVGVRRLVRQRGGDKHLNENLAPLRRFLEGQVNRPWNKVHSEIRERIKPGNTVQEHLLTHVAQFLKTDVMKAAVSAGAPCGLIDNETGWWRRGTPLREGDLYVDPDDGLIKRARWRLKGMRGAPARSDDAANRVRLLAPDLAGLRVNGVWYGAPLYSYGISTAPDVRARSRRPQKVFHVGGRELREWVDPIEGPVWAHDRDKLAHLAKQYGPGRLAGPKRQFSGRELKRYGLENSGQDR
jgi:hypothetical protein